MVDGPAAGGGKRREEFDSKSDGALLSGDMPAFGKTD
jgi:hypothetical protein